jgi:hypothetical protein
MRFTYRGIRVAMAAVLSLSVLPAFANVIDDAYRLCKAMESTNLTMQCEVKGFGSMVDVTIDTNGAEARRICAGVADQMAQLTSSFGGTWKLRIFSPYSGERPIATCTLR